MFVVYAHEMLPGTGAVEGNNGSEAGGVGGEGEPAVPDLPGLLAVHRLTPTITRSCLSGHPVNIYTYLVQ